MKNKYEIRDDVTAIFLRSKKYGNMETLISTSKLDRAKAFPYTWYSNYHIKSKSFYVQGNTTLADGKKTAESLHRWITNAPQMTEVDHENHDTLNNTDDNLRVLTKVQNGHNRKGPNRDNKSGHLGVCYVKLSNKWSAYSTGKHLGYYETVEEAAKVVDYYRANFLPHSREARNNEETVEIVYPKPRKLLENQCGIKGIWWSKQKKKWAICLRINGKKKHVGYSKELNGAIDKLEEAKKEYKIS